MNGYVILFLHLIALFFVVILQTSAIQGLDFLYNINVIYYISIVFIFYNRLDRAVLWTIFGGFLMDIFSSYPFGIMSVTFSLSVLLVYVLYSKVFTNRSAYSLFLLLLSGIFINNLILVILLGIYNVVGNVNMYIELIKYFGFGVSNGFILFIFFIIVGFCKLIVERWILKKT